MYLIGWFFTGAIVTYCIIWIMALRSDMRNNVRALVNEDVIKEAARYINTFNRKA